MNYREKIEQRCASGWKYPEAIVYETVSGGRWGHVERYYYFNGKEFQFCFALPSWALQARKSRKYSKELAELSRCTYGLPMYPLQGFITMGVKQDAK